MAIKISDMEPYGKSISDNDMFEMVAQNELKSYRVSAQNIADYCKLVNNGAFRGLTKKALDEFTYADTGVWLWTGDDSQAPVAGMTEGFVEVLSYYKPGDETVTNLSFIQRFSAGSLVYQRLYSAGKWPPTWSSLTNRNGNRIEYGVAPASGDSGTHVNFSPAFKSEPAVSLTVVGSKTNYVYQPQLLSVTSQGFDFIIYRSSIVSVKTEEKTTTTESGSTKTTETTYISERGQWEVATDVGVNWIATLEEG